MSDLKRHQGAKRAARLAGTRRTATRTIRSEKDKADCPRRQRKQRRWENE